MSLRNKRSHGTRDGAADRPQTPAKAELPPGRVGCIHITTGANRRGVSQGALVTATGHASHVPPDIMPLCSPSSHLQRPLFLAPKASGLSRDRLSPLGLLPQPCDYGLDVGYLLGPLTKAGELWRILAIRRCIDPGNHQAFGGEQPPRSHQEVALAPLEASTRSDLEPSVASRAKHDCCLRVLEREHDHGLGDTRAGRNVNRSLRLGP